MIGERARVTASSFRHRLRTLVTAADREREVDEELRFHLEMAIEQNRERGMTPEEARRTALRDFGGVEQVREACRDERGMPPLETLAKDVRWSLRSLRRNPVFSAAAVAVLGIGIGAVTAIAPILYGVLVAPLPYPSPERLVALWESSPEPGWEQANVSPANLLDWREQVRAFGGVTGYGWPGGWALGGEGRAERVEGCQVLGSFLAVLGVAPQLGRDLRDEDNWKGDEPAALISYELWQRRFGGAPDIVGRRIELDGRPRTVVGVAPRGFAFPRPGLDVWIPFDWQASFKGEAWFRRAHFLQAVARLAPQATVAGARQQLGTLAAQLQKRYPDTNKDMTGGLTPLKEWIVGDIEKPLAVLFAAVVLLLLVTCSNVAGLLLARSGTRARELGLRAALGASRGRLARQLLTESLVLAALGGTVGALLGVAGTRLLLALAGETLPRAHEVGASLPALAAALGATALAALLFGIAPALRLAGSPPARRLRQQGTSAGPETAWSRGALVALEVALAMVLLAGSAITLRSFAALSAVDPGFRAQGVLAANLDLPPARYPESAQVTAFQHRVLERARSLPGVAEAALASSLPLEGKVWTSDLLVEGRPPEEHDVEFHRRIVTPSYFRTAGVRLVRGPGFAPGVDAASPPVVVVNETLARRHFPGQNPVGRRIAISTDAPLDKPLWRQVVGVVADERIEGLTVAPMAEVFVPLGQERLGDPPTAVRKVALLVRVRSGEPMSLFPALREAVRQLDPESPLYDARTFEGILAEATHRERLLTVLLGLFGSTALVLATVGLYGLIAFTLAARRQEIAIRIALGAGPAHVVRTTVAWALGFCGVGILAGLPLAGAAGQGLAGLLYGVRPADPTSLAAAAAVLSAAALAASLLPARRATRIDPMQTLRRE